MADKLLDAISIGGAATSVTLVFEQVAFWLSMGASIIAIVAGIISIILKIKKACKDGEITKEEKKEILEDVSDIKEQIKQINK